MACIAPADAALRMGLSSEEELRGALGKRSLAKRDAMSGRAPESSRLQGLPRRSPRPVRPGQRVL